MLLFGVNASYAHYSQGIYCLANEFKIDGYGCEILECNINDKTDEVLHKLFLRSKDKKAVGFSCYIWNINLMFTFAEELKKLLPDIKIIFGGPEVSFEDEEFLEKYKFIDFLIKGEGEKALLPLYISILNNEETESVIDGEKFGDFEKRNISADFYGDITKHFTIYYESARGCPYSCSYCISGIEKERIRAKTVEDVISDIMCVYSEHERYSTKIHVVKFCDRTFNFDIKRANLIYSELISMAEKSIRKNDLLKYQFEICPTLFNEESFAIISSAPKDLFQFEIGLQSLNDDTLKSIDRHIDCEKSLENIRRLKGFGNIHIHLDLIVGLPFEDLNLFKNGLNRIYELGDFIQIGFLKLLKGTKIRREAEKYGYKYKSVPPYTILQNDFMSYEDIFFLYDIEKIYKKYSSPAFSSSLEYIYITLYKENIFDLLETLVKYYRENDLFNGNISQKQAFLAFYNTFKDKADCELLKEKLSNDFYAYEKKYLRW